MLAFGASAADIVHENWRLWQLRRVAVYAEDQTLQTQVFGAGRYEQVTLLYINQLTELALYEPREGIYLGAYIFSDAVVNGDIGRFEQLMGRHSIYKYFLEPKSDFPSDFVFESAVRGRAPFFVLQEFWDDGAIEGIAREFGYYFSPIFMQPPKPQRDENTEDYQERFARMRETFRAHAPHVAFVYTVDVADVDIAEDFYPGDDYVDWVGLRALASLSPRRPFKGDVLDAIEEVYFTFQARKPMFVSIGISRQSNYDFIYRPQLAAAELERVYTALIDEYPRIKGIIYLNLNEIRQTDPVLAQGPRQPQNISDNYLITDDVVLKSMYREFVSHENVLDSITARGRDSGRVTFAQDSLTHETMRSRHSALRVGGSYYISELTLADELRIPRNRLRGRHITRYGVRYYPFASLEASGEWILQSDESHIMLVPRF